MASLTTLSPTNRASLTASSGIHADVISERGYTTATTQAQVLAAGYADYQAKYLPGLLIPTYDVWGKLAGYQYRADKPRKDKNGKDCKYDNPDGAKMGLDVHPRILPLLKRPDVDLWVTEGMKKNDCAISHDLCCICLPGVSQWNHPDQWEQIALKGRNVYICFDNDVAIKVEVRQQLEGLRTFLRKRQAKVYVVYIPYDEDTDEKVGLDDFLANGGTVSQLYGYASKHLRQADNPTQCMIAHMKRLLRGQGDVLDTGAVELHDHITAANMEALTKTIKGIRDAYAGVDDARKWACASLWNKVHDLLDDGTRKPNGFWGTLASDLFGPYASQVRTWSSIIKYFNGGENPRLPFWLHDHLYRQQNLDHVQVQTIFAAYAEQPMKKTAINNLIEELTGQPAIERNLARGQGKLEIPDMPFGTPAQWQAAARECDKDGRGQELRERMKAVLAWALDTENSAQVFAAQKNVMPDEPATECITISQVFAPQKNMEPVEIESTGICLEIVDTQETPDVPLYCQKPAGADHTPRDTDTDDLDDYDADDYPILAPHDVDDDLYEEYGFLIDRADCGTLPDTMNMDVQDAYERRDHARLTTLDAKYDLYRRAQRIAPKEIAPCSPTSIATLFEDTPRASNLSMYA